MQSRLPPKETRQTLLCNDNNIIILLLGNAVPAASKRDKTGTCVCENDNNIILLLQEMLSRLPPKETRQTLLFSATMPSDVKTIASLGMRRNYAFVDTVGEDENTHQHVPQQFVTQKSKFTFFFIYSDIMCAFVCVCVCACVQHVPNSSVTQKSI